MSRRAAGYVLAAIIVLAFVLRCDQIADRTLWFDEAFSYTLVSRFSPWEIVIRTARDVHPPLYYLLLQGWVSCVGDSLAGLRSLSVLFGVATVAASYAVGRDAVAGRDTDETELRLARVTGITTAALVAVSAAQIRWSWEARMYTLATFLLMSSTWCLIRALDASPSRARRWWVGFTSLSTAMLYTHNYALLSFVGQCLFIAVEILRRHGRWSGWWRAAGFWPAATSVAAVVLLYLPWIPVLDAQQSQVQNDYWTGSATVLSIPRAWFALLVPTNNTYYLPDQWAIVFGNFLLVFIGLLAYSFRRVERLSLALMVSPVAIAYLVSITSVSIIVDRHFLLAHLFALLGVAGLVSRLIPSPINWLLSGLLVFNSLHGFYNYRTELDVNAKPGVRGAVEYVIENRRAEEPILVLHPCIYFSAIFYADNKEDIKLYTLPENIRHYTGKPILTPEDVLPLDALDQIRAERFWVIDTDGYSPGYSRLKLPADVETKAFKKFPDVYFFQGDVFVTVYERNSPGTDSPRNDSNNR